MTLIGTPRFTFSARDKGYPEHIGRIQSQRGGMLLWLLVVAGVLVAALLLALPIVIERTAESWMRENTSSSDFEIEDVDFNLFTGRIDIEYADASSAEDQSKLLEFDGGGTWISWLPLLDKRVSLGKLTLRDAHIDVHIDEAGRTTIAGFEIEAEKESGEDNVEAGWQVGFGPVDFENVEIAINSPIANQIVFVETLHVDALATWEPESGADINLTMRASGGTAHIDGTIYPFASPLRLVGSFDLVDASFEEMPDLIALIGLEKPSGTVSIDGQIDLTHGALAQDVVSKISGTGIVDNLEFLRPQLRQRFHYGHGEFTGKLVIDFETGMTAELNGIGEDLAIIDDTLNIELVQIDNFEATNAKYNGINDIRTDRFHATNLRLLERESEEDDVKHYELTIAELNIEPLALSLERLDIGDLELKGVQGFYSVIDGLFPSSQSTGRDVDDQDATDANAVLDDPGRAEGSIIDNYHFSVDHLLIHDQSQFILTDSTVEPPLIVQLDEFEFELGDLTTKNPDESSDIRVQGKIGKYSSFNIGGKIYPQIDTPTASINGNITSLDLSRFSGYVRSFLGYRLISGSLDATFDANIRDEHLVANADIKANRLRMEELPADQRPPDIETTDIPIGTALALLRDKNDDIELNIPIEGDLKNLDVGLGDAIGQAVGTATKKSMETAVMVLYAPLGIAKLIGKFAGSAGKLRFDSIEFTAGDATLDDQDIAYLREVSALLAEKDGVQLSVCGIATPADYLAVGDQDNNTTDGNSNAAGDQNGNASATVIARQRGEVVKDYLVNQGKIEPRRLFVCSPEVDIAQNAQPRVELSI